MARLTVQLGGSLVVPVAALLRYPANWRARAFIEAGLTVPVRHCECIARIKRTIRSHEMRMASGYPSVEGPTQ